MSESGDVPTRGFKALLYRAGILVTPEEKERLRKMTMRERALDQSIPQLLIAVPFVLLLGAGWRGWTGLGYAAVGCVVVVVGLFFFQNQDQGDQSGPSR